jgi:hypothetical protein
MAIIVTPYNNIDTPYSPSDEALLNSSITQSSFNSSIDYIEYTLSTIDKSYLNTNYSFSNYSFPNSGITSNNITDIILDPSSDVKNNNISGGEYIAKYNFLKNELTSSYNNKIFFIKNISADRTEVTLSCISSSINLINDVNNFKTQLNSNPEYFQDFYLNFGDDILCVANNISINNETLDILINLYDPLPNNLNIKNSLWIVTQIADPLEFNISFTPDIIPFITNSLSLKGPNFNLSVKDQVNNSTNFETYSSLITSSLLSTSYSQLNNLVSSSGIEIGIDYTDFSNFIHFSSAVTRINNFYYKKQLIDQYQQEINVLNNITSLTTTGNITLLTNQVNNIIENFDGYEYFLYYDTGSYSYPKSGSTVPYTLYPAGSPEVRSWLGDADNLTGILGSASIYDQSNLDYLYNTIPNFIQEDPQNDPYKLFVEMVAQSYDNIWIYYKDVTNRYNADNRLDSGISKDLVANALRSFGVKLYQNNFSTNDLYSAFLGYGAINPEITGSTPVTAGSGQEYINNYITASYDASVMPLDDINKETYKRLYHNLPYLAKTKGTIPGLRALINCFGVPDTILRISEFGGRDKDTSTYDYFDQQYNYALRVTGSTDYLLTAFTLNQDWDMSVPSKKPSSIQFRFKPDEYISSHNSQSLIYIRDSAYAVYSASLLSLEYTGSGYISSSYSGSTYSSSYAYARLVFYPNPNDLTTSASIYQPFFNGDWWTVQLDRTSGSNDTFNLYAGSKGYYDGYDGNQILYLASSSVSITTTNTPWNGSSGNVYFSRFANNPLNFGGKNFIGYTGSIQEIRYWTKTGSIESFKDFVMNPHSIDYFEEENKYADYLAFRAPLGSELEVITSSFNAMTSVHPKVTGSWVTTSSFEFNISNYTITGLTITSSNIESYFYDQPIVGIKNRVTDKIQIVSSSYPTGSVLSQYRSLEQTYPTLGSETPDINLLEVAFSPQNEINDDIISSLGYFNIGEYIGDPRQVSSSATTYPDLVNLSNNFFQKYFASYNLFDYIRLIKYFDNSLFKMIKDFVPARTSLTSGVVIKQHLLERNKYPQPQVEWEELDYSGSITTAFMSGGTGGTFDSYNFTGSTIPPTFINNTQSWGEEIKTPVGLLTISHSTQDEFYNGELPNSLIIITDGELNEANTIKYPSDTAIVYNPTLYISNITNESTFTNPNTSPNSGEVFLWWDSGSLTNPGNTKTVVPSRQLVTSLGKTAADFLVNKTNGVKYIKLNNIDANGNDQSDYLTQLQTITLSYPDRSDVTYNIAGYQNLEDYFLYSIGPYAPGGMNNFNTSSAGDIKDYEFSFNTDTLAPAYNKVPSRITTFASSSLIVSVTPPVTGSGIDYNLQVLTIPRSGFTGLFTPTRTPNTSIDINYTLYIENNASSNRDIRTFIQDSNSNDRTEIVTSSFTALASSGQVAYPITLTLNKSEFISGSKYYIGVVCENINVPNSNLIFYQNSTITFTQTPSEFNGSSSLTIFDPYVSNFDYNEYNALINNAETPQTSVFFMDVDYSQNPVIPVNQSLILDESADRAYVQDSNYTSQAWSNIRYNGSKTNSYRIISQ